MSGIRVSARGSRPGAFGATEWMLLCGVALMWGSAYLFIESALRSMSPGMLAMAQTLLGAATLACVPGAHAPIQRSDWLRVVVLGIVWMAVPVILLNSAQQWISSSLAGMLGGSTPLFAALFAWLFFHGGPRGVQLVGLLIGCLGVVSIFVPVLGSTSSTTIGVVLALLASAFFGLSANLTVSLQQRYGSLPVVFRATLVAFVVTVPYAFSTSARLDLTLYGIAAVVVLGIFTSGLAYVAMATLVGRAGASRGAIAIYFIPVVATVLGVALGGDEVLTLQVVGIILVILGAYLTSRRDEQVPTRREVTLEEHDRLAAGATADVPANEEG